MELWPHYLRNLVDIAPTVRCSAVPTSFRGEVPALQTFTSAVFVKPVPVMPRIQPRVCQVIKDCSAGIAPC